MSDFSPSPFVQSSALLTELFEYTPITIIDTIIDAVNGSLLKAITGIDTQMKRVDIERAQGRYEQERENGTKYLTKVFQKAVDDAFDRYEMYVMRNILSFDVKLLQGGWIRLPHQEGVDFSDVEAAQNAPQRVQAAQLELVQVQEEVKVYEAALNDLNETYKTLERYLASLPESTEDLALDLNTLRDHASRVLEVEPFPARKPFELALEDAADESRERFNLRVLRESIDDL